jgi:hypothetical protein
MNNIGLTLEIKEKNTEIKGKNIEINNNSIWTHEKIKKSIKLLKNNEIYRIGDAINFKKDHKVIQELLSSKIYDNTILKNYFIHNKQIDILEIIQNKKKLLNLDLTKFDKTLFVHIRLGDDINGRGLGNPKVFDYFKNHINNSTFVNVVIVTALHYGINQDSKIYTNNKWKYRDANYENNIDIFYKLIHSLNNKNIEIISNEDVDLDLIYLSYSKNLLICPLTGSFSNLVKKLNNQIYAKITPNFNLLDKTLNLCSFGIAKQSSEYNKIMNANKAKRGKISSKEGFTGTGEYSHTAIDDLLPWWEINMMIPVLINKIIIYSRPNYGIRLTNFNIELFKNNNEKISIFIENKNKKETIIYNLDQPIKNIIKVRLQKIAPQPKNHYHFNLNAVQLYS